MQCTIETYDLIVNPQGLCIDYLVSMPCYNCTLVDNTHMDKLLDKLTSYNLFNNLLPGVVFISLAEVTTTYVLTTGELIVDAFIYYFAGMVISRVGSLIIKPLLELVGFLQSAEYKDFVLASQKDPKLEILSETNNTYRTFCAVFLCLPILKGFSSLSAYYPWLDRNSSWILIVILLLMFLFSYRQQTNYVVKRINTNL